MGTAILFVVIPTYIILNPRWSAEMSLSRLPTIGRIEHLKNDTRTRSSDSFAWFQARDGQAIHLNDSVYCGDRSQARVWLKGGGSILVGEKSLVVFRGDANENIANLANGNFRFAIEGKTKVAIGDSVATFEGQNSEVQVFIDKVHGPQVQLLKGSVTMAEGAKPPVNLSLSSIVRLEKKMAKVTAPEVPVLQTHLTTISYTWRFYDLYEFIGQRLMEKSNVPEVVPLSLNLKWANHAHDIQIEMARDREFNARLGSNTVFLGTNFLRATYDKIHYSHVEQFLAQPRFLSGSAPKIKTETTDVILLSQKASSHIVLSVPFKALGFVVQASTEESFHPSKSRIFWSQDTSFNLSFYHPGTYFYRFRSVNDQQELSEWSDVIRFQASTSEIPPAPRLVRAKHSGFVGETFASEWRSRGNQTTIDVIDSEGALITCLTGATPTWIPRRDGAYHLYAYAIDRYGRRSPPSKPLILDVQPKPAPVLAVVPKKAERAPAQEVAQNPARIEGTSFVKLDAPKDPSRNERYRASRLSAEGFAWTVYSDQQNWSANNLPITTGIGLQGIRWWNHSGVEGAMKTGLFGVNQAGSRTSLKDFEARYHYRFFTPFPFSLSRELQISLFLGGEVYRNSGNMLSNGYDLVKFGTSLEFPWGNRWEAGGEFTGGYGFDKTQKYEVSGHVAYFLNEAWSLGIGYRIHLLQAGSPSVPPDGQLPYREGYTEGYSVLNYYF